MAESPTEPGFRLPSRSGSRITLDRGLILALITAWGSCEGYKRVVPEAVAAQESSIEPRVRALEVGLAVLVNEVQGLRREGKKP